MHKRYTDVDGLEDQVTASLLDEDEEESQDEELASPVHGRRAVARIKFLVVIPFLIFFALLYIPLFHSVTRHRNVALPGWGSNISRHLPDYIQPNRNTTVIEPWNVCESGSNKTRILVLVVVCSAIENFDARDTIRETWGNTSAFNYAGFRAMHAALRGNYLEANKQNWSDYVINEEVKNLTEANFVIRVLFLVGQTKVAFENEFPDEMQARISQEADMYGDLVQEGFLDTYFNLTLKSVMLLKWVTHNCDDKIKYVLKVDDDTFINIPNLLHVLLGGTVPIYNTTLGFYDRDSVLVKKSKNRLVDTKDLLLGHLFCGVKPVADTTSKWYTPFYLFEGEFYPAYLSGTAYLMSMNAVRRLYNASLSTPYFHLEDVYLTGICASKIDIKRTHHPLFFYSNARDRKKFCALRGMISQHNFTPDELKLAYDAVTNASIKCDGPPKNLVTPKLKLQMKKKCHQ